MRYYNTSFFTDKFIIWNRNIFRNASKMDVLGLWGIWEVDNKRENNYQTACISVFVQMRPGPAWSRSAKILIPTSACLDFRSNGGQKRPSTKPSKSTLGLGFISGTQLTLWRKITGDRGHMSRSSFKWH